MLAMESSRVVALVACLAAAALGAVLWIARGGARDEEPRLPSALGADGQPPSEALGLEGTDLDAGRSSGDAPGVEDVAPPQPSPRGSGRVHGRVLDQDDAAVAGARVWLARGSSKQ